MYKKIIVSFLILFHSFLLFSSKSKEKKNQFKEEIIVTATLTEESILNVIDSFSLITKKELNSLKPLDLSEALSLSSSTLSLSSGAYGQFSSVFIRGASSKHTVLLINGVKINDPASLSFDYSPISADTFQQIEIVNGPQSSLYGSEAMGGVINLIPEKTNGLSLTLFGGKNSSFGEKVSFGKRFGKNTLSLIYSGKKIKGDFTNSDFDNKNIYFNWDIENKKFSLSPFFYYVSSSTGIPFNYGFPSPNRKSTTEMNLLAFPFKYKLSEKSFFDLNLSFYKRDYTLKDPDAFWGSFYHSKSDNYQLSSKFVASPFKNTTSLFGFELFKSKITEETENGFSFIDENYNSFSFFGEQLYRTERLNLALGLRYDKFSEFDGYLSPKISVSYNVLSNEILISPYFIFSKGFRAPKVSEFASPWGSPSLKPEKSLNYETGVKFAKNNILLTFSLFNTKYEDLITFDFITYKLKNSGEDKIKGFSSSLTYMFKNNKLSISFLKLSSKNAVTGEELLRRPSFILKGSLNIFYKRLNIFFGGRYVGERKDFDEKNFTVVDAESFSVFYLNLNFAISKNLSFFAKINNVFNEKYYEIYGYPSPKRWLFGGVNIKL